MSKLTRNASQIINKCENYKEVKRINEFCIVPGCKQSKQNSNCRLFRFPRDMTKREIWFTLCGLEEMKTCYKKLRICDKHFEKKHLGQKNLVNQAKPTLLLPSSDIENNMHLCCLTMQSERLKQLKQLSSRESILLTKYKLLEDKLKLLKMKKKSLETQNYQLKRRITENNFPIQKCTNLHNMLSELGHLTKDGVTICNMLMKQPKLSWTNDEYKIAANIFIRSREIYSHLRNVQKLNLPHQSSVYRWLEAKDYNMKLFTVENRTINDESTMIDQLTTNDEPTMNDERDESTTNDLLHERESIEIDPVNECRNKKITKINNFSTKEKINKKNNLKDEQNRKENKENDVAVYTIILNENNLELSYITETERRSKNDIDDEIDMDCDEYVIELCE